MGREKQASDTGAVVFKRLYGVKPDTFEKMKGILQKEFDDVHKNGGKPPKLTVENKVKAGSKEIKKYDAPRSPCQRLVESDVLSPELIVERTRQYGLYNPVQLQHTVNKAVLALREAVAAQSPSSGRKPAA
jgi:hypothetical protein